MKNSYSKYEVDTIAIYYFAIDQILTVYQATTR